MKYNFDEIVNRRNTSSLKWDVLDNELPMWVADMDFPTCKEVQEEIQKRASIGAYGYSIIPDEFFESIISWWKKRHHFTFKKENMIFSTGVVAAISSIVRKITSVGENVVVLSPVYNIFYNSILNNGRNVLASNLIYNNYQYEIDFVDLEEKLANKQTSLMILCNPHNPVGKIFTKEELEKIGELCFKYHVYVISDEIHCDITRPHKEYIPFASVSEKCYINSITCLAASKTFNLAGLQSACVIVNDPFLYHKVWRGLNTDEVAEPNFFAISANIAAFKYGEEWVNQLNEYLFNNKDFVENFINKNIPSLKVIHSDATYLVWIDISSISNDSVSFCKNLRESTGLYVSEGEEYGTNGKKFIRMNIATSRKNVLDGLNRLKFFVNKKDL